MQLTIKTSLFKWLLVQKRKRRKLSLTLRLAGVLREMDSQSVIRVGTKFRGNRSGPECHYNVRMRKMIFVR